MNTLNEQRTNHEGARVVRILVVDDSPTILHAICALLEIEEGLAIVGRATDGQEAVAAVAGLRPEFVLMDVSMPCMNGLVATKLLAQLFPATKVFLMSSEDPQYLREECLACGAAAFIYKPRFRKELLAAVQANRQSGKVRDKEGGPVFARLCSAAVPVAG